MLLLPKTPPLTYPNIKKFKGPKMDSLHFTQVILQGNSFGKGYGHWTRSTQKNQQVILKVNSFGKGYGHWTRSTQKKSTSYFKGKFLWKRLRTLDT